MKKVVFILLSLFLITACENEPLDSSVQIENPDPNPNPNPNPNPGPGSDSDDLTLLVYELDVQLNITFFGIPFQTITNSDLNIQDDKLVSGVISFSLEGSPFVSETQTITRNAQGQIVSDISVDASNSITNETIVTYSGGVVESISYDFFEDDIDDYVYTFTSDGNTITRSEQGTSITTVFTLDGSGRVVQKESFDDGFPIQNEVVTYGATGNIESSEITGELVQSVTFSFDDNPNPLQLVYSDNYLLNFLADEYEDEIGATIAQFHSTNNWTGANYDGDSFSFDLTYNSVGRIETRNIAISLGEEFSTSISETFTYVN